LVFTNWLGKRWVFQRATLAGTDILLQQPKPVPAVHCTLITINEQEFNDYLGEWLQPDKLSSVLQNIVAYEPKIIVVDIDTSAPRFGSTVVPAGNSKIVWARVSHEALTSNRPRSYVWQAGAVLGSRRIVAIDAHAASLHWMTIQALCDSGDSSACALVKNDTATDDLKMRPFLTDWNFRTIPLSDVMDTGGNTIPHAGGLGEVVMLGANFSDIHTTTFGPELGIELTASAIESELALKVGASPIYEWSHWILKILLAFAIAWLNNRFLPLWATTGTLLLLGLVFMASFLGIYYGVFRMDFLPVMIGIWIEQLIETAEHAHHAAH
jgi:CHASE2 domain-containing sensor protein